MWTKWERIESNRRIRSNFDSTSFSKLQNYKLWTIFYFNVDQRPSKVHELCIFYVVISFFFNLFQMLLLSPIFSLLLLFWKWKNKYSLRCYGIWIMFIFFPCARRLFRNLNQNKQSFFSSFSSSSLLSKQTEKLALVSLKHLNVNRKRFDLIKFIIFFTWKFNNISSYLLLNSALHVNRLYRHVGIQQY